ncbi:MAG TPA: CehA/McbA family metallohydrolase [Longilinea sp.]|nr:CehA/McbA family metallohydrolase [Longilinea sp.]
MQDYLTLSIHVDPSQQGSYFTVPFEVPEYMERLTLRYHYARRPETLHTQANGRFTGRGEQNIIDLGLISPDGKQAGASGSDKLEFTLSETDATPGYTPCPILPGTWQILVGAYKVAPDGVDVDYEITLESKSRRLFKGDLHTHTLASDGVHTLEELAWKAKRNGLDFVAVTDHNQFVAAEALPHVEGVTMIPGVEWTHYQGHANFLGISQPYDGSFFTNTFEEAQSKFISARQRGALITINHPFDEICGFQFDLQQLPFDCIEVWNGPMRESNLKGVGYWQQLLSTGQKIPICGGSDYHRDTPFIFLGGPTMGLFAGSRGTSDLLKAIRKGNGFITFAPNGPTLELNAGDAIMGESVCWSDWHELRIQADGLLAGDVLRVITGKRSEVILQAPSDGSADLVYPMDSPGFARVEILRTFIPGLPMLPALLSNPIYFDED